MYTDIHNSTKIFINGWLEESLKYYTPYLNIMNFTNVQYVGANIQEVQRIIVGLVRVRRHESCQQTKAESSRDGHTRTCSEYCDHESDFAGVIITLLTLVCLQPGVLGGWVLV